MAESKSVRLAKAAGAYIDSDGAVELTEGDNITITKDPNTSTVTVTTTAASTGKAIAMSIVFGG